MANYDVQIAIAVKGQKELQRTRVETRLLQRSIDRLNKTVVKESKKSVKSFDSLSKEVSRASRALNTAAIGTDDYRKAIRNVIKVEDQYSKELTKKTKIFQIEKLAYKEGISFSQAKEKIIQKEIKAENELAKARLRSSGIGSAIGRGAASAVGSGIIGGGFPLLFGQGPLAAAAGGIGGVAGGALSAIPGMGQFGFALSIAGTAIGSAMEDLTQALQKPEENIENLVNKLGLVGTPTGELALKLEKMGLKSSAARLLLDKFNEKMGTTPEEILETNQKLMDFKNKINELGTEITLFLTGVLGPFIDAIAGSLDTGKLLRLLKEQEGIENFGRVQREIVLKANQRAAAQFKTNQAMGAGGPSYTQLRDQNIDILLKERLGIVDKDFSGVGMSNGDIGTFNPELEKLATEAFTQKEIKPLQQALEIEKNRFKVSDQKLAVMKEEFELENLLAELNLTKLENEALGTDELAQQIQKLEAQIDLQQQVVTNAKALADPFREVANIIEMDIGNGIKGLIKGTQTLGDVLNNVLNKLADAFLNMAIFGNVGGGSITGGLMGSLFSGIGGLFGGSGPTMGGGGYFDPITGLGTAGPNFGLAEGGTARAGRTYMVGERGPELFRPGVTGTVVPNHALGGSTNIVVNVDATGSSVEGDEEQGRELGRLISAAVQSELIQQKRPGGILA